MENIGVNKGYFEFKKTIAAGATQGFDVYGNGFYIRKASGTIVVSTDKTSPVAFVEREGIAVDVGITFKRIEIKNNNTYPVYVDLFAGFGTFLNDKAFISEAVTALIPVTDSADHTGTVITSLAAGAEAVSNGVPFNNNLQKREMIVTNLDSTNNLQIRNENDDILMECFPLQNLVVASSDYAKVYNASAGPMNCRIVEVWYYNNT